MNFEQYRRELEIALGETMKLDPTMHDNIQSRVLLSEDIGLYNVIFNNFAHALITLGPSALSTSCAPAHMALKSIADRLNPNCRMILTHGWVRMDEHHIFENDLEYLKREIVENKIMNKKDAINIHTWLTCVKGDDVEIYDFTLACHMSLNYLDYEIEPHEPFLVSKSNPAIDNRMQYHPVLLGANVLVQLNITRADWEPPPIIY